MVIEKYGIEEEHGRHTKLAAERCCRFHYRCIAVVKGHQHRPRREVPAIRVSQNIL